MGIVVVARCAARTAAMVVTRMDSWVSLHHIPRESGKALVDTLRPAHVEHVVAALDQAVAAQALFEGIDENRAGFRRPAAQEGNASGTSRRASSEWPR
jgi:hypothetical protein